MAMSTNFNKNMKGQSTEARTDFKCLINSRDYPKLVLLWNKMNNDHLFLICCVLCISLSSDLQLVMHTVKDPTVQSAMLIMCLFQLSPSLSPSISAFIAITTYG